MLLAKTSSRGRPGQDPDVRSRRYQAQLKDNIGGANYAGSNLLKTGSTATDADQGQHHLVLQSRLRPARSRTGTIDIDVWPTSA